MWGRVRQGAWGKQRRHSERQPRCVSKGQHASAHTDTPNHLPRNTQGARLLAVGACSGATDRV